MQTYKISTTIKLVTMDCYKCHVVFAIPKEMDMRCLEWGDIIYCPNGHPQVYCETENDRLRHRLDQREAELERTNQRLDGALNELVNKKRLITQMRNRIKAGVCTECHRHFENLERHMKTKHSK